jgi:hypothetical protein
LNPFFRYLLGLPLAPNAFDLFPLILQLAHTTFDCFHLFYAFSYLSTHLIVSVSFNLPVVPQRFPKIMKFSKRRAQQDKKEIKM